MKTDSTYLGKVIRVDSSTVEVEVSSEIPSAAPIINGRLYKIGQIGVIPPFLTEALSRIRSCVEEYVALA